MDVTLLLSGNSTAGDGGGGGEESGGSTTARSILTVSKSGEVTSPYPTCDENSDNLELGLGLSISGVGGGGVGGGAGGGGLKSSGVEAGPSWCQYARILTAKDLSSMASKPNSCCSSSSINVSNPSTSGTKRTATDSLSPPNGTSVVGWPPVSKAHRLTSLSNRTNGVKDLSDVQKVNLAKKYRSVKVNMDGTLIGRKIDLNAHSSYETLAQTLEEMFFGRRPSRLLDETSGFVLTYEDKDGDCMLVGDVPWQMFLCSVKRLRIMKKSDSNELAPSFQESNERHRTNAV